MQTSHEPISTSAWGSHLAYVPPSSTLTCNREALVLLRSHDESQHQCTLALAQNTRASPRDSAARRRRDVLHAKASKVCRTHIVHRRAVTAQAITINLDDDIDFPVVSWRDAVLVHVHLHGATSSRRILPPRTVAYGHCARRSLLGSTTLFVRPHGHQPPRCAPNARCHTLLPSGLSPAPLRGPRHPMVTIARRSSDVTRLPRCTIL